MYVGLSKMGVRIRFIRICLTSSHPQLLFSFINLLLLLLLSHTVISNELSGENENNNTPLSDTTNKESEVVNIPDDPTLGPTSETTSFGEHEHWNSTDLPMSNEHSTDEATSSRNSTDVPASRVNSTDEAKSNRNSTAVAKSRSGNATANSVAAKGGSASATSLTEEDGNSKSRSVAIEDGNSKASSKAGGKGDSNSTAYQEREGTQKEDPDRERNLFNIEKQRFSTKSMNHTFFRKGRDSGGPAVTMQTSNVSPQLDYSEINSN